MSDYDYSHEKGRDIGDVKGMEQPLKTGKTGRGTANPAPKIVSRLREMRTVTALNGIIMLFLVRCTNCKDR